jgi:hypothetical protein
MNSFAEWLSSTRPSVFIQGHEAWMIPTLQSLHIMGIGVVVASVMMMALRVLGRIGMDQSILQNKRRFGPWLTGALSLMLVTGGLLVIAEPVRELVTLSFWLKMALVAAFAALSIVFQRSVSRRGPDWEVAFVERKAIRVAALLTFLMLGCIILLGRLIAYDHIWGHLSPATKA